MWDSIPLASRIALVAWMLVAAPIAGCRWGLGDWRSGQPLPGVEQAHARSEHAAPGLPAEPETDQDTLAVLGEDYWIRSIGHAGNDGRREPARRWRYPALEALLALPPRERPNFQRALASDDPTVSTNAAICLARLGDPSGIEALAAGVRNRQVKLEMRLAAAEALGSIERPSPAGRLVELIDRYGPVGSPDQTGSIPQLHAELLRGLARHTDPAGDRRFVDALSSPAAAVRLEALLAWAAGRRGTLPASAVDLRTDSNSQVRMAALAALAHQRAPNAHQYLSEALFDHDLSVRVAAIEALGELPDPEAQATLARLLEEGPELIRVAAARALLALDFQRAVLAAQRDKSWRVRLEVARALADHPNRMGAVLARKLLDDPSSAVQTEVVKAIANWPLGRAGPILLQAMSSLGYLPRQSAARQLAARWPPAAGFPVDAAPKRRSGLVAELEDRFRQEIESVDRGGPVQAAGYRALGEAVDPEGLPQHEPASDALDRLAAKDVSARRRAAADLAKLAARRPLSPSATDRLASLTVMESDPLVWQSVLLAVAADSGEASTGLAYAAIGHPSSEVRRRACEHLAAHADAKHADALLPALYDESVSVRCAAARALGLGRTLDDTRPLEQLLTAANGTLRVEAAAALCRLGDLAGPAALERLSYSNDQTVRLQVATVMGQVGDASFVPSLIRMLDDRQGIRRAALESLPNVVGRNVAETADEGSPGRARPIEIWKQWFQSGGHTAGTGPITP